MSTKLAITGAVVTILFITSLTAYAEDCPAKCGQEDPLTVQLRARVLPDLTHLAADLSAVLNQVDSRKLIVGQVSSAKKNTVGLGRLLQTCKRGDGAHERLDAMMETVGRVESTMSQCGAPTARLDLKLPVASHRKALKESAEIYVAIAPLADEDRVKSVIAYSKGKRLALDASKPPSTPTLVIVGAEPQCDDPGYPLRTAKEAGEEEEQKQVDDYVGIPWIYLYDDNESWPCGDPEIYVRVKRFRFSTFSILNSKVDLPGVNGEQVWYNLGDPNNTYKFVNTADYAPVVRLEFWEDDSGFHGSDDFLGATLVTWTGLSYGGYSFRNVGDVRIGIDRD